MSAATIRRVVTGLNAEGRSCVLFDGPVPQLGPGPGVVWRTETLPADNSGSADTAVPYSMELLHAGGSTLLLVEIPPGMPSFLHATDTIDYLVVIRGEIVIELEAGEARLGPGDFIVDRGVIHAWRNDGPETVIMASVVLPASPVGNGRTV
jgi:quercetin dioxygenase-like cupin family protein